jgi:hypothetical protein
MLKIKIKKFKLKSIPHFILYFSREKKYQDLNNSFWQKLMIIINLEISDSKQSSETLIYASSV